MPDSFRLRLRHFRWAMYGEQTVRREAVIRQFMQCDIDILGEPTNLAEIELDSGNNYICLESWISRISQIRINERRILKAMAQLTVDSRKKVMIQYLSFWTRWTRSVWRVLPKNLKKKALRKIVLTPTLVCLKKLLLTSKVYAYCREKLKDVLDPKVAEDLETIITAVDSVKNADFRISFDPTLVRGMSYYTGPIFEIAMDEFGGSVGGGGRYDEMIGKFTGQNTSACGFSIGFERIVMLLLERGYEIPENGAKKAYLIEKNMPADKLLPILKQAEEERKNGVQVNISIMKKNKKFQKEQMTAEGYTEFVEFFNKIKKETESWLKV